MEVYRSKKIPLHGSSSSSTAATLLRVSQIFQFQLIHPTKSVNISSTRFVFAGETLTLAQSLCPWLPARL